jgi:hypothetical protein
MRNLATIQAISNLEPILGADAIEKATVLGWELVVKKGEFKVGDLCVYCEIDSVLPERVEFEFLRDRKFRVKTIKLRGQISQGICFPVSILPQDTKIEIGKDVTEVLGIKKWEPYEEEQRMANQNGKSSYPHWMPKWLGKKLFRYKWIRDFFKKSQGNKTFPSLVPKTDETRVQVLQSLLDKYKGSVCYYTEKLDGSSITLYLINGKFGVCSRNMDLKKDKTNRFWKVVIDHDLERKVKELFKGQNIALQGELIGQGVQGNKYKLTGNDIYFFNLYDIKKHSFSSFIHLMGVCKLLKEKTVPALCMNYILPNSIPELVELSKGKSMLCDIPREGIVIRPLSEITDHDFSRSLVHERVSFKSVNPEFLLKFGE